jgi:hypothetical protein
MPIATILQFTDHELRIPGMVPYLNQTTDDEALVKSILFPIGWEEARKKQLGIPPMDLLLQIPGAVQKAGARLTALSIEMLPHGDYSILTRGKEDLDNFTAAMQRLKHFNLRTRCDPDTGPMAAQEPDQVDHLWKFLRAILDTGSMEDLLWQGDVPPSFSLGSLITLRPRLNLKQLFMEGIYLHLAKLEKFVTLLETLIQICRMRRINLLSVTWSEALDILRRKASRYTSVENPFGAECDELSDENKKALFGKPNGDIFGESKVDLYIQGCRKENPLIASSAISEEIEMGDADETTCKQSRHDRRICVELLGMSYRHVIDKFSKSRI